MRPLAAFVCVFALGCSSEPAPAPASIEARTAPAVEVSRPVAVVASALPDPAAVPFKPKGLVNGDYAPELVLPDLLNDGTFRLSEHLGEGSTAPTRAAIIGFVASWYGPYRASLPTLAEIKAEHGDDLQIILLATDDDQAGRLKEAQHVRKAGLDAVVLDPTLEVIRAYKGARKNVPHFFIVNKIGEVLVQDRGFGKKVKPILPKQVRYALNNPDYVQRGKR